MSGRSDESSNDKTSNNGLKSLSNNKLNLPPKYDKQVSNSSVDGLIPEIKPISNPADFLESSTKATLDNILANSGTVLCDSITSPQGSPTGTANSYLQVDMDDKQFSGDFSHRKSVKLHSRKPVYKPEDCTLPYDLFPGARETIRGEKMPLKMPPFKKTAASLTLPSRLELLGNQEFRVGAALDPKNIGNAVVGYDLDYNVDNIGERKLYLLPFIFSKAMAYMMLFFRLLIIFVIVVMILSTTSAVEINVGRGFSFTIIYFLIFSLDNWC